MTNAFSDKNLLPKNLKTSDGNFIAYHSTDNLEPNNLPGIIFMPGFMSNMDGSKALAIEEFARERGQRFVRFDYFGHGQSSGNFSDGHIGIWLENAISVLDQLSEGPQILIGSSMGGWLMFLTSLARPDRVAGLVGLAAAPDFTEELLLKELTEDQLAEIRVNGQVTVSSDYDDDYIFTKKLIDEGRKYLILNDRIGINSPVRLIHGIDDVSVPWEFAIRIQEQLISTDVEVILLKNSDHRLSKPNNLVKLRFVLDGLMDCL